MASHDNLLPLNVKDIERRFNRASNYFDDADFVHSATREGLLARLKPMVVEAKTVVDLGSATGSATRQLQKRFRPARVISVDLSRDMLRQGLRKQSFFSAKAPAIQAHAAALPFAEQSVDLVFANLLLPFIDNPTDLFTEVARVLRKDGLLVFATLGPDSLLELRQAWQAVDNYAHVNRFLDMHDMGDAAVKAGLRDPVLDVDRMTVTYDSPAALFRDLTAIGGRNCLGDRNPALVSKVRFAAMIDTLNAASCDGRLQLNLELVYGHCWGSGPRAQPGDYRIDANRIGHRSR
jgi:malonyl-CoA O-methyltransferase